MTADQTVSRKVTCGAEKQECIANFISGKLSHLLPRWMHVRLGRSRLSIVNHRLATICLRELQYNYHNVVRQLAYIYA